MRSASFFAGCVLSALLFGAMAGVASAAGDNSFSQVSRGRYLVTVGDCAACHTAPGGEYLSGGLSVPTPFGDIPSANLTPDQQTGLGSWNRRQFVRAMREGVSADGSHLYPAFPYPSFTKVTEDDLSAIWAYLNTIDPVHNDVEEPDLYWPLGWRPLMVGWKMLFFEPGVYQPDPDKSEQWNRGAYLVEGLGHCGSCHSPRNRFGATQTEHRYTGSELQQWFAPNLTGNEKEGLGGWSNQDIVEYLKTGSNGDHVAAGLMREVVEKSTQHMTVEDLSAIATYLKDLPGRDLPGDPDAAPAPQGGDDTDNGTDKDPAPAAREDTARDDTEGGLGRALYVDNCTGCHRYDGSGMENVFPKLRDSPIVQADSPASLIHVVLRGARSPNTEQRPNHLTMPAFGWKLNDEQIAALISYIRSAWGNEASPVDADTVADLRTATRLEPKTFNPQ